ncbi:hypothetical protein SAMN05444266_103114 [Chitinophaga jiangningensis]|uniref:TerB family tellurite resistance protein n=1 Tax=Chitinophaga jiangningensis TaxID=1419482 RepID=A0A1M7A3U0_9BACT|nr:hypothetical protein [Chitinophaga jiangningensis]SHL37384.1 hypothetical protein SAMN05444266_103114 [Chitinophaga jiangningensis]
MIRKAVIMLCFLMAMLVANAYCQADELAQLGLNIQKLNQFRKILSEMKKGYTVLSKGYNLVRDVSKRNFSIHQIFLDNLYKVSPVVYKYHRVHEIIQLQTQTLQRYRSNLRFFRAASISDSEFRTFQTIQNNYLKQLTQELEELLMVLTAGKLRMNDAERLETIDRLYIRVSGQAEKMLRLQKNAQSLYGQMNKQSLDIMDLRSNILHR